MKLRDRLAIGGLLIALVLVGGALVVRLPSNPNDASAAPTVVATPYREGVVGHPNSVNPLTWRTQADQDLVALVFRGLVRNGPGGTVVPDLASGWSVSTDGRTYTFNLRPSTYWEDGTEVTSADVVFTIGMLQDARYDGPIGSSWQGVRTSSDGPYVVHFTMTLPIAGFLRQVELPLLPSHLLKGTPANKLADSDFSTHPIGNGPYRIKSLSNERAVLERVDSVVAVPLPTPSPTPKPTPSPTPTPIPTPTPVPTATPGGTSGASGGPEVGPGTTPTPKLVATPTPIPTATPKPVPIPSGSILGTIHEIDMLFYDDAASAAKAFRAGDLDAVGGLTTEQTDVAMARPLSRTVPYRWSSLLSVVINQRTDHPELRDANTRTGLFAAIDRSAVLSKVLEGRGTIAELPVPDWSPLFDRGAVTATAYNLADAQGYLDTAGWVLSNDGWTAPKGKAIYSMELLTPVAADNPVLYATAQEVATAWKTIGLDVKVVAVPVSTYVSRLDSGDYDAAVATFDVGLDPDLGPMLLSSQIGLGGSNVSGVNDQTLDQLLLTARKAPNTSDRQDAMTAVEKYISTTLPLLPLCFRDYDFVVSNRVQQLLSNDLGDPSGRFWDVLDWRLASGR